MNNTKTCFAAVLFMFGIITRSLLADGSYCSYYDGKRYEFEVTDKEQAGCPKWDTEKDANPPLSAADALAKAKKFIATIKTKEGLSWKFDDLALVKIDGWIWRAHYHLINNNGITEGVWPEMNCLILMNGKVIQPKITKDK